MASPPARAQYDPLTSSMGTETRLAHELQEMSRREAQMNREQMVLSVQQIEKAKKDELRFRFTVGYIVFSVVAWIVGNIYTEGRKFPLHMRWWKRAPYLLPDGKGGVTVTKTAVPCKGKFSYSMYAVIVAAMYPSLYSILDALTIFESLNAQGAHFLMSAVQHFETHPRTKGRLTMLHWCGDNTQTHAAKLFQCPGGWLSPGTQTGQTDEARKETIARSWAASKGENIWYDFFPDPNTPAFWEVPVIKEVVDVYNTCDVDTTATAFSNLYVLYDGGLCAAATSAVVTDKAADLFAHYFSAPGQFSPMCGAAAAQGAVNGAVMSGTSTLGMANVGGISGGGPFILGVMAMSAIGAGVGAAAGSAAAREKCRNSE